MSLLPLDASGIHPASARPEPPAETPEAFGQRLARERAERVLATGGAASTRRDLRLNDLLVEIMELHEVLRRKIDRLDDVVNGRSA